VLADLLQLAGWIKQAFFLVDRVSLVNQTFKTYLPKSSPVNPVTEKDKTDRVYVCTYPMMMGLIDETKGNGARFSIGRFDLIIIDEAHLSVYQKYGAIFRCFNSLLVGLKPGVPTDAYELETVVTDGFLVSPRVQ